MRFDPILDGALAKRMQPAFAAKAGVLSAYLAAEGVTGAQAVFEGRYGFFNLYDGYREGAGQQMRTNDFGVPYGPDNLTRDLGRRFEVETARWAKVVKDAGIRAE